MHRLYKKLALVLALTVFVSSIPVDSSALSSSNSPAESSKTSSTTSKPTETRSPQIIGEAVEKRDLYTKHYIKDDFSYEAAIYPIPVHYKENGTWKDIDNTLVEKQDSSGKAVLENQSNAIKVQFSKELSDISADKANGKDSGKLVTLTNGKYELSWSFQNSLKSQVTKENPKAVKPLASSPLNDSKANASQAETKRTLSNLSSAVVYKGVRQDVDLQYILQSNQVKENILLHKLSDNNQFVFEIHAGKLKGVVNSDHSVSFYDPDTNEEVFFFEAPYMTDAAGNTSTDIDILLTQTKAGYTLTVIPDKAWLESSDRVYPVAVDPTVITSREATAITDTYVSSNNPTTSNYLSDRFLVGYNNASGGSGVNRAYVKFSLPALTSADMVVDATLWLYTRSASTGTQQINVHEVTSDWAPQTLTWTNQATTGSAIQDFRFVQSAAAYAWNVTTLVKKWTTTGKNYGLMLKSNNETAAGYNEFYSADISQSLQAYRPYVSITYVNASGLEDYMTYHAFSAGRAGTVYAGDYNGNVVVTHDDIAMNGNRMPITLTHVFNNHEMAANFGYGNGWRLNVAQTIEQTTIGGTAYYVYVDADGTLHYFKAATNPTYDESGLDLELTVDGSGVYTMKDTGYNEYRFTPQNGSALRYLSQITDANGNTQKITYNTQNKVSQIEDGAGRKVVLGYNGSGLLAMVADPSNRVTSYGYTGNQLTSITYPDGKASSYTYTASGNMTSAVNHDGYKVALAYVGERPYRVASLTETHTDGTTGQKTNFHYEQFPGINTFTDAKGQKSTYYFDNYGRTTAIADNLGYVSMASFGNSTAIPGGSGSSNKNKLIASIQKQQPVMNLAKNPGAEYTGSDWTVLTSGGSSGSATMTNTQKHTGQKSFQVTKTNAAGMHYYQQGLTLTKGKNYAFQVYIKTEGISQTNGKGASLLVTYVDKDGNPVSQQSRIINGTQDWARVGFTIPVENTNTQVFVKLVMDGETGTAWFDSLQIEEYSLGNAFNLIDNGDFTYGTANTWYGENAGATDGVITDPGSSRPLRLDNKVLRITGVGNAVRKFNQTLAHSGKANDVYVLGGWSKGDAAYYAGLSVNKMTLELNYTDGTTGYFDVFFNKDTSDWQYASGMFIAQKDYSAIKVHLVYHYNTNEALFDGIHLYQSTESSLSYDSRGNVISSTQADKNGVTSYNYPTTGSVNSPDKITEPDGNASEYEYDDHYNLLNTYTTRSGVARDIQTAYQYDAYGNTLSSEIKNVSMAGISIKTSSVYTVDGNYLNLIRDASGEYVHYDYNTTKGLINRVSDSSGRQTTYEYEGTTDRLKKVYSTQLPNVANEYFYTGDNLTGIRHNGFDYTFTYDKLGYVTGVAAGGQALITNTFEASTGNLESSTYGNGQTLQYTYDAGNRLTEVISGGEKVFTFSYDARGNLAQVGDTKSGIHTKTVYDLMGKITQIYDSLNWDTFFTYDNGGKLTRMDEYFRDSANPFSFSTQYTYGDFNNMTQVEYGNSQILYNYLEAGQDYTLGRLNGTSITVGNTVIHTSTLSYEPGVESSTTNRLSRIDNYGNTIDYTYTENGNIRTITENGKTTIYSYDAVNQLTREDNEAIGKTIVYNYDNGGNILSKTEYAYTLDTVPVNPVDTVTYTYDSVWTDKLTSYDGKQVVTDEIGNTLSYDGWAFTWQKGRELAGMSGNGKTITYSYNENGIRTQKTVNGITTSYHLIGDLVTFESNGTDSIHYTYGLDNVLVSMNLKGVEYYYVRNGQGDITGLIDSTGTQVVSYTYDAWGKLVSTTGSLASTVGVKNQYRYRGYRYDSETGYYYCQSRYYNPEWGRWLNADSMTGFTGELLSHNMFAYCMNNPVNCYDPDGDVAWWVVGAVVGAVAGGVVGAVVSYKKNGKVDWRYVAGGAAGGALIGAGAGALAQATYTGMIGAGAATAGGGALAKLSQSTINFAVSNMSRLQHAFKHAKDLGFGNWNSNTAQQWKCFITSNLQNYTKIFQNTLGNDSVTGYYRYVNGMHVATYIYNSGPNQGLVATVVKLSAQQLQKFGLY